MDLLNFFFVWQFLVYNLSSYFNYFIQIIYCKQIFHFRSKHTGNRWTITKIQYRTDRMLLSILWICPGWHLYGMQFNRYSKPSRRWWYNGWSRTMSIHTRYRYEYTTALCNTISGILHVVVFVVVVYVTVIVVVVQNNFKYIAAKNNFILLDNIVMEYILLYRRMDNNIFTSTCRVIVEYVLTKKN